MGGGSITLNASGGGSYLWSNGVAVASNVISATGTYTVTVTSTNGCSSSKSAAITGVTCDPLCQVPQGLNTTNITKSTAKLNWTGIAGVSQYMYQLKNNATGITTNGTVSQATPYAVVSGLSASTSYTWKVKTICSSNSKSAFSVSVDFTTPALKEGDQGNDILLSGGFMLYPNPADNLIHILRNVKADEKCIVQISDASGKIVYDKSYSPGVVDTEITIDISMYEKGIYFVRCSSASNTGIQKLIIH